MQADKNAMRRPVVPLLLDRLRETRKGDRGCLHGRESRSWEHLLQGAMILPRRNPCNGDMSLSHR
jgi:hypothetical protein